MNNSHTPPAVFRVLLIEDDIKRRHTFKNWLPDWARLVWAKSAGSAMGLIRRDAGRNYGAVLLDHDLVMRTITSEDNSLSGTDVAHALSRHFSIDIPILIHSINPARAPAIARLLDDKGFWVTRMPYDELTPSFFLEWLEEAHDIWLSLGPPEK